MYIQIKLTQYELSAEYIYMYRMYILNIHTEQQSIYIRHWAFCNN